jgi:hypothetical protein
VTWTPRASSTFCARKASSAISVADRTAAGGAGTVVVVGTASVVLSVMTNVGSV